MEWYMAVKVAIQTMFDEEFRKKLFIAIAIVLAIVFGGFGIVMLPVLVGSLPQASFSKDAKTSHDILNDFILILSQYEDKINDNVANMKKDIESKSTDKNLKINVSISYPTISLIIAFDNVMHKGRLTSDMNTPIDKDELFKFLDGCVVYTSDNNSINVSIKPIKEIANKFFRNEEDKGMFMYIHYSVNNLDLGNNTPSVEIPNLKYLEGGIRLPYLSQLDEAWTYAPYGNSTIGKSGCGITCLSMVTNGLIPEANILPPEMANWSANNGFYISGVGTAWSIFQAAANKYNLKCTNLSRDNPQQILDELTKGNPIIVSMSPGHFTRGGHFIVLRGISNNGKILVNDPASGERSQQEWDLSIILTESSTNSPSCFWSFSK